jgi:beta-lactamase regulating signal transducer with metallopeptidase domain
VWEALFNSLWQGILLVAAVWAALHLLPRLNAATRYAVWYATLLGLVALPLVSGRFASIPVSDPAALSVARDHHRPFQAVTPAPRTEPSVPPVGRAAGRSAEQTEPRLVADHAPSASTQQAPQAAPTSSRSALRVKAGAWLRVLGWLWLLAVAVQWTRLARSLVQIARIKSRAGVMRTFPSGRWRQWCRDTRRGSRVWLGWSDEIQVPGVLGFVRPAILFPRRLQGALTASETEQVALHELAHVARYDDWWQILERLIEGVLFFHPAVRFVSSRLALEREIACDDWVMHRLRSPKEYACCLTRLAEHRATRPLPVPGAVRSRKHILRRVEMLLNNNRNARPGLSRAVTALAALVIALGVVQIGFVRPIVAVTPPTPPAPPAAPAAPAAQPAPPAWPEAPGARRWAQTTPPADTPEPSPAPEPPPLPKAAKGTPAPPAPPESPVGRKSWNSNRSDDGTSLTINQDGDQITYVWSDGAHKVRAEADGRLEFSGDGTGLKSISSDGYFLISERSRGKTRELEIVPGRGGHLEYFYAEDDKPLPYDQNAQRWFSELLPDMMRETGWGAQERVAALRASGGTSGVLREISLIHSDYVKRIYFEELLESGPLADQDLQAVFHQAGRELESDYEMAELLIGYADYVGAHAATRDAYVEAVGSMESDYEVRRVLTALGTQGDLTDEYAQAVLELAAGMESDYEKAELLLELAEYSREHVSARDLYLEAVASIESDYEKRRVLEQILSPRETDEAFVTAVLDVVGTIGSDYERAELLIHLAEDASPYDAALSSYIRAVESIGSDYEARRALSALTWSDSLPEPICLDLLRAASRLESDYEKAEFLLEHAKYFTATEAVRDAFDRTVNTIDSDYERERVEAAFYRQSRKAGGRGETY